MKRVDLHVHTSASDGTLTPAEAAGYAAERGLAAIAVTDHDTCTGVAGAMATGADCGVEVVSGIELSVEYRGLGVHILGYFLDPADPALSALLDWVVSERERRNEAIAAAMRADGIPVTAEGLRERSPGAVIGRPHFAAALIERGLAKDTRDAFDRFLGKGRKYHRPRTYIPMDAAFEAIRAAGGKAVFAHPFQYALPEPELLVLARTLADAGIRGIECIYSGYSAEQVQYLKDLAGYYGLCVTGGSDFHGARKPRIALGGVDVPYELLERLREAP